MQFSKLHRPKWQRYFEALSKALRQDTTPWNVMLRATAPGEIGSQAVAPGLEFERITYDPAADALSVRLDDFDYCIDYPTSIWAVVKDDGDIELLVILRLDGTRDYIDFERRLP